MSRNCESDDYEAILFDKKIIDDFIKDEVGKNPESELKYFINDKDEIANINYYEAIENAKTNFWNNDDNIIEHNESIREALSQQIK